MYIKFHALDSGVFRDLLSELICFACNANKLD